MSLFGQGLLEALRLLVTGDPEVWQITWLSLQVSATATLLSLLVGIPVGALLALSRFPGRAFVVSLVNTGMGLPPVVVGLFVTILLWRNGALGFLELLYTPTAMVTGQLVIAAPIVTGLTLAAVMAGFGGVISEVGASMMLGGNIKGATRVLTTATVLETGKGNFDVAIALSVILLLITFLVNWALSVIQQRRRA